MHIYSLNKIKILVKNKNVTQLSLLWLSQIGASISAFFTQLLLVRILTTAEYGAYATAFTFTGIIASLSGLGAGTYWLRIFGKEGWLGFRWIKNTLLLAISSIALSFIIVIATALLINTSVATKVLLLFFSSIVISQGLATMAFAVYQLEGKYNKLSLFQFLTHGLRFFIVIILYFLGQSLIMVGISYTVASLLLAIFYIPTIFRMYKGKVDLKGHKQPFNFNNGIINQPGLKDTFKNTLPFCLAGVFYLIYYQSNIFLLNMLVGEKASGIFNIAFTGLTVIFLFPSAIYQGFLLPKIHRWAEHDKSKITTIYNLGGKSITLFGVLLMIMLAGTALWIIPLLFGKDFLLSGYILIILSISIPIRLLGSNLESILVTENNMIKKVSYQGIGAIFNICANLIFIHFYGIYGAALSTILTELVVTTLFLRGVNKHVKVIN
ncbi:oligosaccharide flippase family protein, partial [Priestia filamentosa]|uniref:oligosaccharide flippase family protein n=1 Tax=Priestia filamentosa TaxID=1402861 RepID=UPI00397B6D53